MIKATRMAVAAALMFGLTGPSLAQNQPQQPQSQQNRQEQQRQQQQQAKQRGATAGGQLQVKRANDLLSFDVYNMQGQKLGAIEDIVLDARSAQVAYIVLEHDDPVFDKHYAVPLSLLKMGRADNKRVAVMNVPAAAMRQAPTFDENNSEAWPDRANPFFAQFLQGRDRDQFEGRTQQQPADRARFAVEDDAANDGWNINRWFSFHDPMDTRRLSQVIGMDVDNVAGKNLGEIEDVAIDMRTGRVAYALISYGGTLNVGEEMAAVPWTAMKPRLDEDEFVLNTDRDELAEFRIASNENLATVDFGRRLHERFNLEPFWVGTYGFAGDDEFQGGGAWSAQSQFNQQYDPQKTQTIQGELISVGSFRPAAGAEEGMRLRVRTQDDKVVTVYAGPSWFARARDFDLDRGDQVTIVGSPATVDDRHVILAKELRSDNQTLQLRDEQGRPQWQDQQRQRSRYQQQRQSRDAYGIDRLQSDYDRQREMNQRYQERQDFSRDRNAPQYRDDYERQRMQQQYPQYQQQQDDRYNQQRYDSGRRSDEVYDRFDDRTQYRDPYR